MPPLAVKDIEADPPEPRVPRIESADARAVVERLAGTNLVERGSVTIISVEAIRDRAADRWARKRDDVCAYVERKCDEHLSFQDIRARIDETDFLIAMTTEEGIAAQAIALKILEEVLIFFLGSAEATDLRVSAVTSILDDVIATAPIDLAKIAAARRRPSDHAYQGAVDPKEVRRRTPVSFVAASGERVRVDFAVEQVISLRHQVTAALRIQPTVSFLATGATIPAHRFSRLADDDIAFIDRATLAYAAMYMPKNVRSDPPLILPTSFRTMGSRKGRSALMAVEGATPEQLRHGVMMELMDVDLGTPTARLAEVVGLVSQLCRGVMARIWPSRDPMAPIRGTRFQGITFDLRGLPLDEATLRMLFDHMAKHARRKAPVLIAQGLSGHEAMAHAEAAGFTHAALNAPPQTDESAAGAASR
jgi:hypothetical protein